MLDFDGLIKKITLTRHNQCSWKLIALKLHSSW
jgi:hypothetical protein